MPTKARNTSTPCGISARGLLFLRFILKPYFVGKANSSEEGLFITPLDVDNKEKSRSQDGS